MGEPLPAVYVCWRYLGDTNQPKVGGLPHLPCTAKVHGCHCAAHVSLSFAFWGHTKPHCRNWYSLTSLCTPLTLLLSGVYCFHCPCSLPGRQINYKSLQEKPSNHFFSFHFQSPVELYFMWLCGLLQSQHINLLHSKLSKLYLNKKKKEPEGFFSSTYLHNIRSIPKPAFHQKTRKSLGTLRINSLRILETVNSLRILETVALLSCLNSSLIACKIKGKGQLHDVSCDIRWQVSSNSYTLFQVKTHFAFY